MPLWGFLLVWSIVLSLPAIAALAIGRHRINRATGRLLLALCFAGATAYSLWRIEWFDVWRHGTPPPSLLLVYSGYAVAYGIAGWIIAAAILPRSASLGERAWVDNVSVDVSPLDRRE